MIAGALRVAVTRDEAADGPLSAALTRHGLTAVACPVIFEVEAPDPEPLARAAAALERYDWLVAASARAVLALMRARGGARLPAGLRTAAVGERTAAALVAHGAVAPLVAPHAGAWTLIESLRAADAWPGRRALLPRALDGATDLAEALRRFGAEVDEVAAYRTIERPRDEIAAAFRTAAPDRVVIASPSAARALIGAIGAEALRRLEPVVAIGPTTAMALVALGVRAVVPERADFESVADLLAGMAPVENEGTT